MLLLHSVIDKLIDSTVKVDVAADVLEINEMAVQTTPAFPNVRGVK